MKHLQTSANWILLKPLLFTSSNSLTITDQKNLQHYLECVDPVTVSIRDAAQFSYWIIYNVRTSSKWPKLSPIYYY